MQDRRAPYLPPPDVGADEFMARAAMPPDWEPPPVETDEDVARSNRFVALIVLSIFLIGIAASAIAFAAALSR